MLLRALARHSRESFGESTLIRFDPPREMLLGIFGLLGLSAEKVNLRYF
jgi:hypothetical protein